MVDLTIERLRLHFEDARGHEHRVKRIASLAASLVCERLGQRLEGTTGTLEMGTLRATPLEIDLAGASDEQTARRIVDAWMAALPDLDTGGEFDAGD